MEIRSIVRRLLPGRGRVAPARTERKVVLADYYAAMASAGLYSTYQARPWPVERAVAEAYERLVYVYKAVEAIAGHASRLPYRLRQGEEVLDDHPMYGVLNKQANPLESGQQFRKRLATQILLSKRGAFVEKTLSASGAVVRLDLLPPGRTYPVPGTGQTLIDRFEVLRADGTRQPIPAERVIWFREPHPLDPYSGVTPLEAAGLSLELDFFARLYNVTALKNDGRPGGIVAVDGELDDWGMAELRSRFGTGPQEAGKLTVIEGQVSYIDTAARPSDMAYAETAKTAKTEILTAFGVGESVIGYAADRTYDNAEAELYNFWTITMPPFLTLLAAGFDGDSEDELDGFLDTSDVEVLQRAAAARRAQALEEFTAGLISIDEYRERIGLRPFDMPRTRALWLPTGKTLVATSDADQKALDAEAADKVPPALAANMAPGRLAALPPGTGSDRDDGDGDGAQQEEPQEADVPKAAAVVATRHLGPPAPVLGPVATTARPVLRLVRPAPAAAQTKAADRASEPDPAAWQRLETTLAAAITTIMLRLTERTAARLSSPRTRKGTRHWVAEHDVDTRVGTKAVDAASAVDAGRWQEEVEQATHPILTAAAVAAAAALVADLAPDAPVSYVLEPLVASVTAILGASAAVQAERLRVLIADLDSSGADMEAITAAVRQRAPQLTDWAQRVAVQAATVTINGARDSAATALVSIGQPIDKVWRSRRDEQVRPTHRAAHGQVQPLGEWFEVGAALLRYPGDPSGPPAETYGCRCWVMHRSRVSGRFVAAPERTRFTRAEREAADAERQAS
ncbi:phage portal protein [Planobispora siamensis]|uniref:Phage portal protein, HK97 family n=1 Tax=Planobispora siamensis TaxID=936338 RepID=A0A8J3WMW8_9ACTN|nr:phage portal protein [Planobispora siamensis]GIH95418.1 hypothetical protein Psi01_60480 [Planobispora siamensis]